MKSCRSVEHPCKSICKQHVLPAYAGVKIFLLECDWDKRYLNLSSQSLIIMIVSNECSKFDWKLFGCYTKL